MRRRQACKLEVVRLRIAGYPIRSVGVSAAAVASRRRRNRGRDRRRGLQMRLMVRLRHQPRGHRVPIVVVPVGRLLVGGRGRMHPPHTVRVVIEVRHGDADEMHDCETIT